jgi:hypothetical protein
VKKDSCFIQQRTTYLVQVEWSSTKWCYYKDWEEHYAMLMEAFDTQPDNPQGTQKIGQFFRYIMYGWHQE